MRYILVSLCCVVSFLKTAGIAMADDTGWYTTKRFKSTTRIKVILLNELNKNRKSCPVIITRRKMPITDYYSEWLTVVDPALPPEDGENNGRPLPSQLDDIDKDGIWDELFFLADFKPQETKTLYIYIGRNTADIEHHTTAIIGSYGKHIVPWWESEHIGWKLWFSDSADMYGKREPKLASHINLINYYGHNAPYDAGIDIMLVGRTFGAGGICLFEEPAQPDSLSRPRFSPSQDKGPFTGMRYAYDVVVNGPLRSIIRAHTMNWITGKGSYELEQYFTAYRNKNYYTCRVHYLSFFPEEPETDFGCGIRKMPRENEMYQEDGIVISSTDDLMNVITPLEGDPGLKEGVKEFLGLALVVREEYNPQYHYTESFEENYVFRLPVTDDLTYEYLVAGAWSEGSVLTTAKEFNDYVIKTAEEYNSQIEIKELTPEKK